MTRLSAPCVVCEDSPTYWLPRRQRAVCSLHAAAAADDGLLVVPIEATVRTKTGKVLTPADIEALADEAERGYDISRIRGRSRRRRP